MTTLIENLRDALRWFRGEPPVPHVADELEAEPTRVWLRDQEAAARVSAQERRDWLERKLVYRKGVDQ